MPKKEIDDGCVMIPKCQECTLACKKYIAKFLLPSMLENKHSLICKNFSKPKRAKKGEG